jgi:hypothetical protein
MERARMRGLLQSGAWCIVALAVLGAGTCAHCLDATRPPELAVYEAVFDYLRVLDMIAARPVLVAAVTRPVEPHSFVRPVPTTVPPCFVTTGDPRDLLESFELANRLAGVVPAAIQRDLDLELVAAAEFTAADGSFSWDEFYRRRGRPASLVRLSNVGFSSEERAIVFVEYACPLCGFGTYLVLGKGRTWFVIDRCDVWVS